MVVPPPPVPRASTPGPSRPASVVVPPPPVPSASTPGPSRPAKRRRLEHSGPMDALVGPCSETRAQHLQRHQGGRRTCPRCRYYLFGDAWTATYGSFATQSGGPTRGRKVWLDERPARWGGSWRLGCSVCAAFDQRRGRDASTLTAGAGAPPTNKRKRGTSGVRGGTKFARCEVCHENLSASHVRDHCLSDMHGLAVKAHLAPDAPVRILLQTDTNDEQLLSGAVPQPADWMRAWRVCMSPASWAQACKQAQTEHFIAQIRARLVKPEAMKSMVLCMNEALRARKR